TECTQIRPRTQQRQQKQQRYGRISSHSTISTSRRNVWCLRCRRTRQSARWTAAAARPTRRSRVCTMLCGHWRRKRECERFPVLSDAHQSRLYVSGCPPTVEPDCRQNASERNGICTEINRPRRPNLL